MTGAYRTEGFIAEELGAWAASLQFEDLSEAAVDAAKRFWIDSLGCAAGGTRTEDAQILLSHYRDMWEGSGGGLGADGRPAAVGPCTVLVSGDRVNVVDAAFLNSHLVRALDFNDVYWKADPCHPSDLICGPLALCELLGLGGRALLLATVIVYELQCRFAEIGRPGIREYGWHHATLSGFASAVAAGAVLGLGAREIAHAVGISATRTGTLGAITAGELTMMKNACDPWASRVGVESALLARRGFTGPRHAIDGKEGLFHTFGHNGVGGEPVRFDAGGLTDGLPRAAGAEYRITACSMKSVPVEALMHSPLSAIMRLRAEHSFSVKEVREIRVEVIARAADILGDPAKYRPTSRETADHSLPYCIAALLVDGVLTGAQFELERVRDPGLGPVMDLVRVLPNEAYEARFPAAQPSRVTLVLDGAAGRHEISAEVDVPKGDPRNPMTDTELMAKVESLAEPVLGRGAGERIAGAVERLEILPTVGPLFDAVLRR